MSNVNSYSLPDNVNGYSWSAPINWSANASWAQYSAPHVYTVVSDYVSTNSNTHFGINCFVKERANLLDTNICNSNFHRKISDYITVSDSEKSNPHSIFHDCLNFNDNRYCSFSSKYSDSFGVFDSLACSIKMHMSEGLLVSDNIATVVDFNRHISESILVNESISSNLNYFLHEELNFIDNVRQYSDFHRKISDYITVSDSEFVNVHSVVSDNLNFNDIVSSNVNSNVDVQLFANDSLLHSAKFYRHLVEDVNMSDSYFANYSCNVNEFFNIFDNFYRGIDCVVSSLSILNQDMNVNDFYNLCQRPFGYSNFVEFVVGEYEYKDAIVKTSITSKNINYNTELDKLDIHIDIPDTDDRGTATIPAERTFVAFNKKYYNTPESISIVVSGGSSSSVIIPRLIESSNIGFYVELRDSSGLLVDGTISWSSKGY